MKTVAVLGASSDRRKFGNKCVRAHLDAGYQVFPVNPHEREIEGLPAYPTLDQVPAELDRISVYLPPALTYELLADVARKGAREVWFNPGSSDSRVSAEAQRLGIAYQNGCSIVDIGRLPSQFP